MTNVRYYTELLLRTEQLVTVPEVLTEAVLLTGNSHRSSTTYSVIRTEVVLRTRNSHRRATASHSKSARTLSRDSVHSAHLLPQSLPNSGRILQTTFHRVVTFRLKSTSNPLRFRDQNSVNSQRDGLVLSA